MDAHSERLPSENTTTSEIDFAEAEYLPDYLATLSKITFYFHFLLTAIALLSVITTIKLKAVHTNLKTILLLQSSMIAIGSVFQLLNGLWFSDDGVEDSLVNSPLLIFCLIAFVAIFTNMVGHVLFIERTIATIYAGSYETNGKCLLFNIAWISILSLLSLFNSIAIYAFYSSNGATIHTEINILSISFHDFALLPVILITVLSLILSFVEIFVMMKLGLYNGAKFTQSIVYRNKKHNLSERYQLSENIRTIRQLCPIFVAHFFTLLIFNVIVAFGYFPKNVRCILYALLASIANLLYFVIAFQTVLFYKPAHHKFIVAINWLRKLLKLDNYNDVHRIEKFSVIRYSKSVQNNPIKIYTTNKGNKIVVQPQLNTIAKQQKLGSGAEKSLEAAANSFPNQPKSNQVPSASKHHTQIYFELLHSQWQ